MISDRRRKDNFKKKEEEKPKVVVIKRKFEPIKLRSTVSSLGYLKESPVMKEANIFNYGPYFGDRYKM